MVPLGLPFDDLDELVNLTDDTYLEVEVPPTFFFGQVDSGEGTSPYLLF